MAETNNQEEPALHATKRTKHDATPDVDPLDRPKKTLKLDSFDDKNPIAGSLDGKSTIDEAKDAQIEAGPEEDENGEYDDEDYGSDEDEDGEEEEDDEKSKNNGEADRKGKGIMRDDKGKGKLILEEEEDDNDDDDSDDDDSSDGGGSELDSDLSDDPLAEVDLDNILPSRTRRKQPPPPGVHIANDLGNDDDDSDDSDA
ncbi:hypothetical protein L484_008703 [Morus notabilis]|uniref:Histone chaperone domain-containing protein n=1 Tax=Morus notabilis TaxID=981085 RepID=W9RP17_9ROSA|nr:prostatic spermine-binding protein [Morus notabilis]EXB62853.1 hypothetical protein L484_008703 [Morus notabilis]